MSNLINPVGPRHETLPIHYLQDQLEEHKLPREHLPICCWPSVPFGYGSLLQVDHWFFTPGQADYIRRQGFQFPWKLELAGTCFASGIHKRATTTRHMTSARFINCIFRLVAPEVMSWQNHTQTRLCLRWCGYWNIFSFTASTNPWLAHTWGLLDIFSFAIYYSKKPFNLYKRSSICHSQGFSPSGGDFLKVFCA